MRYMFKVCVSISMFLEQRKYQQICEYAMHKILYSIH